MTVPTYNDFVRDVQDALAHLYDYAYLERHPLAVRLAAQEGRANRTRAQETRRILLDTLEELNPGENVPIRALERRAYAILFGLYVEGREAAGVASMLGIGERQLRRDRATAVEALATILYDRYLLPQAQEAAPPDEEPLLDEIQRLAQEQERVDLPLFVEKLLLLLDGLAEEQGITVTAAIAEDFPLLQTNPMLLRQILLGMASQALIHAAPADLAFTSQAEAEELSITLCWRCSGGADRSLETLQAELSPVETMAMALGARLLYSSPRPGKCEIQLLFPRQREMTVLVVDDNRELFELFQRFLFGQPYQLIHAASVDQALAMARTAQPAAITLDLMMPNRDGWEFLQIQQADATLSHIPVIVCSVLAEPELAFSLGAAGYLKKPVGAADLLNALAALQPRAWAAAAPPTVPAHRPAPPKM
jgi:CheY-like chemotaxis protein